MQSIAIRLMWFVSVERFSRFPLGPSARVAQIAQLSRATSHPAPFLRVFGLHEGGGIFPRCGTGRLIFGHGAAASSGSNALRDLPAKLMAGRTTLVEPRNKIERHRGGLGFQDPGRVVPT